MGCRVCRARKVRQIPPKKESCMWELAQEINDEQVKCDGRPNGCRNCERLQLECVADDGSTANGSRSSLSPISLRKIRTYRSCQSCRLSKTKCNGDRPKCSRCAAKLIQCVYDGGAAPRWTRNLNKSQANSAEEDSSSPTEQDVMTGIELGDATEDGSVRGSFSKHFDDANEKSSVLSEAGGTSVTGGVTSQNGSNEQLSSNPLAWFVAL